MTDGQFLTAKVSLKVGKPSVLTISGTVLAYSDNATVSVTESDSPELNPAILGVQVIVSEADGPMKGHAHPFGGSVEIAMPGQYRHVNIHAGNGSVLVDVPKE